MSELQAVASEQRCKFLRKLERKRRKIHTEDSHGNAKKAQKGERQRNMEERQRGKKRGWEVEDKAKEKMRRERENICPSVYTSFLPRCKWQRG